MAEKIHFELVTPTAKLVSREVDEVRIPGGGGGFGVRAGHAGLLSTLGAGTLTLVDEGKAERFVVIGGFVEAGPSSVVVLAAEAIPETEVDAAGAKAEIDSALGALAGQAVGSEAYGLADARLTRARAMANL
ncbi:MAG: ATP synthase F1 subunit epsilon [Deltaproteobacteria bacterium]|nr:ATP synthase F1 subunit epsilon [Deltaproteobacteria bacterium]